MGIVYLLLHKGGLCHVHLAQSVLLGNGIALKALLLVKNEAGASGTSMFPSRSLGTR